METMLQAVVIVFMLFLCAICLFAVVVIARDIIYESSRRRELQQERVQQPNVSERTEHTAPIEPVTTPISSVTPEVTPVAEVTATEPEVPTETTAPAEAPVAVIATEPEAEEETALTEGSAAPELDDGAVVFSRVNLTMEEKYGTLSTEFKRFFDDIIRYAMAKEGVKESKHTGYYDYKIGSMRVLRAMIKRGEIVCEFNFIDREFMEYSSASGVKMKKSATQVRVTEASAVGVVKDGIDLVCNQIAELKEHKKELAREKRRERRRRNAELAESETTSTDETEE